MAPQNTTSRLKSVRIEWDDLHDAVLEEIAVTWGKLARVTVKMLPNEAYVKPSRPVLLVGEGLRNLVCPQRNPWGPSDFVNRVSEVDGGGAGSTRIEIEMQSGDVIHLEASSFEVVLEEG